MAAVSVVDDPETALRKKLNLRYATPTAAMPDDPVYGTPEATPPPPAPAPYTAPAPTPRLSTNAIRNPDPGDPYTPAPGPGDNPQPPVPGPTTPPITSPGAPIPTTPTYGAGWTDPGFIGWADYFTGGGEGKNPTFGGNYQGYFNAMFPDDTLTPAMLKAKEGQLASAGIKLMPNAAGVNAKIQLPNGQIIDVIQGAGSGLNRRQWLVGGGGGGAGGTGVATAGAPNAFTNQLREIIMARLGKAQLPVDENDPYIREPFTAAGVQAARTQQKERSDLAERLAATGDTSRSLEMGIQQSAERNAVGLGTLKAKLISDEYNARRQELLDLMQMALQNNDTELAREIQLAQLALQLGMYNNNQNNTAGG